MGGDIFCGVVLVLLLGLNFLIFFLVSLIDVVVLIFYDYVGYEFE